MIKRIAMACLLLLLGGCSISTAGWGSSSGLVIGGPCDSSHSTYECLNYRASNAGGP